MANITKEEFYKLISTLDDVEIEAVTISMESLIAGESFKTALEKTASFLALHPGHEKQASALLNKLAEET